jgi:glycosyltransferase involved in cell wall biosynthesis
MRYLDLARRALTARGTFAAVEAHVLFPVGLIGLVAARIRGVPLVVVAHGSDVRVTAQRNRLYRSLGRLVARSAKVVVANSRDTADHVRTLGAEPVIIPPGVDLSRFSASPRPHRGRVLYLGGDRPEKGVDVALRLADTLAGPGLREIEPEDVPALIAAHDVVLVPSRAEGFGIVAAEAIASGRWVVASDVGGLRDVVTPGVNGTLVSNGDFASAIASVPDYDPALVAATAGPFDVEVQRARMADLYA